MPTFSFRLIARFVVAFVLSFAFVPPASALDDWTCTTYTNSRVVGLGPYNYACAGYSGTCRECGGYNNGGYGYYICYDNGPGSPNVTCVDYQGTMGWGL